MPAKVSLARVGALTGLRRTIAVGQATAKKLPEFRAQVGDLETRLSSLRAVLPDEKDAADLLRRMQTVATQSNLTIKAFAPKATVTKQMHAEWPIALELDGTYHNLALFFDRVGKFTRIVNISGLEVKPSPIPTRGQPYGDLHGPPLCCGNRHPPSLAREARREAWRSECRHESGTLFLRHHDAPSSPSHIPRLRMSPRRHRDAAGAETCRPRPRHRRRRTIPISLAGRRDPFTNLVGGRPAPIRAWEPPARRGPRDCGAKLTVRGVSRAATE